MVLKNFTIIRFIPLLYGIIWDNVFLVEGFSRHILAKKVTKTMAYTKTKIFMMIQKGATLDQLIKETGRNGSRIRSIISEIRRRGYEITFTNSTYKIEV
tara:strand:- start:222 stop:518 length:297 start_codon:yes stop_codon:yes gene_type:complete